MATKKKVEVVIAAKTYVAVGPFELEGEQYEEGDTVVLPAKYRPDPAFDEFRSGAKRRGGQQGMSFSYEGELIEKGKPERQVYRVILPVHEQPAAAAELTPSKEE